jgi:hypothetical protein
MVSWTELIPLTNNHYWSPGIGSYFATRGEKGMAPTGGDQSFTDAYGNMAPADSYPADISGMIVHLQGLWAEGQSVSTLSPERVGLGREIFRLIAEEKFLDGGIAFASDTDLRIHRTNFRNIPKNWTEGQGGVGRYETYFFEDGKDNLNNPGNKAKNYKNVSFLDPDYWEN